MKINYFSIIYLIIYKYDEEYVSVFFESIYIYCSEIIIIFGFEMNKIRIIVVVFIVFVGKIIILIYDNFFWNYV